MEADFTLCEHCLADNELRNEIASRGVPIDTCVICRAVGAILIVLATTFVIRRKTSKAALCLA
jgi:hypothetical protein